MTGKDLETAGRGMLMNSTNCGCTIDMTPGQSRSGTCSCQALIPVESSSTLQEGLLHSQDAPSLTD